MAMTGLEVFDKTTQLTQTWVSDVAEELGWEDKHKAFLGLRATLHVLRDRLTMGEAANLGSQLPILLAGFYYEGWKPEKNPSKERSKEDFLNHFRSHLGNYFQKTDVNDIDAEQIIRAVFSVIAKRIPKGEVEDVTHILPAQLKELWPEAVRN